MIPYVGGKSYLASWIISNFPKNYTQMHYCEVFGGGGWVLFKKEPSNLETYNDLNKSLVNLFRIIRNKYPEFEHRAQWSLHSREMYNEAIDRLKEDKFLSEVDKAVTYAIRKTQTFSGGNSQSWGYAITGDKMMSGKWLPFLKKMELINARLKRTQIECMDFERLIRKYDDRKTLFYVDPPYYEAEHYYTQPGVEFKREDHERLHKVLSKIKGKFTLSYYDHPVIKEMYKKYRIIQKSAVKHSAGASGQNRVGYTKPRSIELLIMNY